MRAERGARPGVRVLDGTHVVVVDDKADARDLMKQALMHDGAAVTATESGIEALDVLRYIIPTVLVADMATPRESGLWLIQEIRKLPVERGGAMPVLAVTAFGLAFPRERALAAGFNEYLAKPLDPRELCRIVAKLAGRAA